MRPNQATMKEPKPTLAALLGKENLNRAWESLRGNMGVTGPKGRDIAICANASGFSGAHQKDSTTPCAESS